MSTDEEIFDIEEYSRAGRAIPPHARRFRIRIDKVVYTINVPEPSGRELLQLAGKLPPEEHSVFQKQRGGSPVKIELDQTVDLRQPGVERFLTLPLDQTEGLVDLRRQFRLPADDEAFLESLGLRWETLSVPVIEGGTSTVRQCVVIYGVAVPPGYNHQHVDIHFRIEAAYPDTQLDMVYVHPALARTDGKPIASLAEVACDGKTWQRWSRHRTAANPWRPGVDGLETHYMLVPEWFRQEFQKR